MVPVIVASGLLLSVLGQRQYVRATTDEVWVAGANLNPGQVIQSRDLVKVRLDEDETAGAVDENLNAGDMVFIDQMTATLTLDNVLKIDDNVLEGVTYNRNIYDDSEEQGSSVIEIDPDGKAATEMIAIAEELMAMKPDNAHEFN